MLKRISDVAYRRLSYFVIAFTIFALICVVCIWDRPHAFGEWDDISLVTVSILNDGNVTIDNQDIEYAKRMMPEWNNDLDNIHLSGYYTKSGDALSWYFPLFAAICVPIMAVLNFFGVSGIYTFCVTNILLYLFALLYALFYSDFSPRNKFGLILLLCINPIILYTMWVSGEVFIFTFLLCTLICWNKKKYNQAALYLSVASTLNPSVLVVGIVMILEYLCQVVHDMGVAQMWKRRKDILVLAVCFVPALMPFAWNLYHMGHINMTAATEVDVNVQSVIGRFGAYLFDFNLGFLPYYGVLLLLFLVAIISAVRKKQKDVLLLEIAFVGTCIVYSMEVHINCGMSGLARYNAWSVTIMIMAFCVWRSKCITQKLMKILDMSVLGSVLWTFLAMISIVLTNPVGYMEMTPIARVVLEYAPHFYNPLPDIFNCRVNHVDEIEYKHNMPIVYRDGNWECRKILACYENKEYILQHIRTSEENVLWLSEKLDALKGEGDKYITIAKDKIIYWEDE